LNRFTLPVKVDHATSRKIPINLTENTAKRLRHELALAHRDASSAKWLKRHHHLKLEHSAAGLTLHSLAWRDLLPALAMLALFGLFLAVGLYGLFAEGVGAEGYLGSLAAIAIGGWFWGKILSRLGRSTTVVVRPGRLKITTRELLRPRTVRECDAGDIQRIESAVSATEGYLVLARTGTKERLLLVEGLKGEQAGLAVAGLIAEKLGIPESGVVGRE